MPNYTRKPTDRLDDDLRRIAERAHNEIADPKRLNRSMDDILRHQRGYDRLLADISKARRMPPVKFEIQERILNTGAEDAVVDGLVDYPL